MGESSCKPFITGFTQTVIFSSKKVLVMRLPKRRGWFWSHRAGDEEEVQARNAKHGAVEGEALALWPMLSQRFFFLLSQVLGAGVPKRKEGRRHGD